MATVTAKQKASLTKKANEIQSTFNKVKGSLSQSDINKASAGLKQASSGISSISKSSGKSSGEMINDSYNKALAEKNAGVITPESVQNQSVMNMPPKNTVINDGLNLDNNNALVSSTDNPYTANQFQFPDFAVGEKAGASETAAVSSLNGAAKYIQSIVGIAKPPEKETENALADTMKELGIKKKQEEKNKYSTQLNTITSQRDAEILKLEGQGRGQTQGFIGGEQARINREAAIQALPVQAQLAGAQGDLDSANALLGQLYQAKSADIQAQQNYKNTLVNTAIQFATSAQSTLLQAKQADIAQESAIAQSNLAYQRQLGLQALEYGQSGLISGISSVDPKSPTFEQDISAYTARLRKPVAAVAGPKPQNIGTADNPIWAIYDDATRSFIPVAGAEGASTANQASKTVALNKFQDTVGSIIGSTALDSVVGTSIFSRGAGNKTGVLGRLLAGGAAGAGAGGAVGLLGGPLAPVTSTVGAIVGGITGATLAASQGVVDAKVTGERQQFLTDVKNLTANLTLDKLGESKAQGITFGALSAPEWEIIAKAAGKITDWEVKDSDGVVIGYNTSEKNFLREMDVIDYYKAQDALLSNIPWQDIQGVKYDETNGTYWKRNSDGTASQLIY